MIIVLPFLREHRLAKPPSVHLLTRRILTSTAKYVPKRDLRSALSLSNLMYRHAMTWFSIEKKKKKMVQLGSTYSFISSGALEMDHWGFQPFVRIPVSFLRLNRQGGLKKGKSLIGADYARLCWP